VGLLGPLWPSPSLLQSVREKTAQVRPPPSQQQQPALLKLQVTELGWRRSGARRVLPAQPHSRSDCSGDFRSRHEQCLVSRICLVASFGVGGRQSGERGTRVHTFFLVEWCWRCLRCCHGTLL